MLNSIYLYISDNTEFIISEKLQETNIGFQILPSYIFF